MVSRYLRRNVSIYVMADFPFSHDTVVGHLNVGYVFMATCRMPQKWRLNVIMAEQICNFFIQKITLITNTIANIHKEGSSWPNVRSVPSSKFLDVIICIMEISVLVDGSPLIFLLSSPVLRSAAQNYRGNKWKMSNSSKQNAEFGIEQ